MPKGPHGEKRPADVIGNGAVREALAARAGRRLVDQIGGEVLLRLIRQPHPSLGHVDQQEPAAGGNRFTCDP
jgi:hypothetical protein